MKSLDFQALKRSMYLKCVCNKALKPDLQQLARLHFVVYFRERLHMAYGGVIHSFLKRPLCVKDTFFIDLYLALLLIDKYSHHYLNVN